MLFRDRREAGRKLAERLGAFAGKDAIVLALPRGGVPVGYEVARALGAPLDVLIVRKLGVPGEEELAMGAIATGGGAWLNREVIDSLGIGEAQVEAAMRAELRELQRREMAFRDGRAPPVVRGRIALLVDDGLATGSTMRAAIRSLRERGPRSIVVAVPVGAPSTCSVLAGEADALVCLATPEPFFGVGQFYRDFRQTGDEEVRALLAAAEQPVTTP